jgi:hypothetical protein
MGERPTVPMMRHYNINDGSNPMPENLPRATPVTVEPNEPYPDGAPPDFSEVVARVHPHQTITEAQHWEDQSIENLAHAGVIPGAVPYTPPDPEAGAEYVDTPRGKKKI